MKYIYISLFILVFLFVCEYADTTDLTPYNFGALGEARGSQSVTWEAQRIDLLSHFRNIPNAAAFFDSLIDTGKYEGKHILAGPYGSDQEINMIEYSTTMTYAQRMVDTAGNWKYIYMVHFLDSIGLDEDSCCLTYADTSWAIINDGRGDGQTRLQFSRGDTLNLKQRRVSYQTLDNRGSMVLTSPTDDIMWPAGYAWLANGSNIDVARAIAYAYRRHFYEDMLVTPMTYIYMDNQYRNAGYLGSYWSFPNRLVFYGDEVRAWPDSSICPGGVLATCDSTPYYTPGAGGPTAGVDFAQGWNDVNINGGSDYFDASTLQIDSVLMQVLDSTANALGMDSIETFGNANWASSIDALSLCDKTSGIFMEGPWQPDRGACFWDTQFEIMNGIIADHPTTMICWMVTPNFVESFDEGVDRSLMAHYTLFLVGQNYYEGKYWSYVMLDLHMDYSTNGWRNIYNVNLGHPEPDSMRTAYYDAGTGCYGGSPRIWVKRRTYLTGVDTTGIVIWRSSAGTTYDWNDDSLQVNVHTLCYEIDINADTGVVADSIFWIKPYMGKILVPVSATGENPPYDVNFSSSKDTINVQTTFTSDCYDDYGIDSLDLFLYEPGTYHGIDDSISIFDTTMGEDVTYFALSKNYTWTYTGDYWVYLVLVDDSDNIFTDSIMVHVNSDLVPPTISNMSTTGILTEGEEDSLKCDITGGTDNYRIDSSDCYVWTPTSESILVAHTLYNPSVEDTTLSLPYTWTMTGNHWIVFKATNKQNEIDTDSIYVLIEEFELPMQIERSEKMVRIRK